MSSSDVANITNALITMDRRTLELWNLIYDNLLPPLPWQDKNNNYLTLFMKSSLRYVDVIKLTSFLLGNGLDPKLILQWYEYRNLLGKQKTKQNINYIIQCFKNGSHKHFYFCLRENTYYNFAGKKRIR